jgi:hypothetical protein
MFNSSTNASNGVKSSMLNLEEEMCMLIYENNQLRNYLKEVRFKLIFLDMFEIGIHFFVFCKKEDNIQLLQSKIRVARQKLVHTKDDYSNILQEESFNSKLNKKVSTCTLSEPLAENTKFPLYSNNIKTNKTTNPLNPSNLNTNNIFKCVNHDSGLDSSSNSTSLGIKIIFD